MQTVLHNTGNPELPRRFSSLNRALMTAWDERITGYIVTPTNDIIQLRKGKRKDVKGKWIPAYA